MNRRILIIGIFVIVLLFVSACSGSPYTKEQRDSLALCLSEKGVKEYGAFWCPNCAKQKKLFGDSFDIIMDKGVYVECDPRGDNSMSELCIEKDVQKYPTWEFPDGKIFVGVIPLDEFVQFTECRI